MANPLEKFFIEKDNSIIFVGNYCEVYIPKIYFEMKISSKKGSDISTFGVFEFKIFSSEEKKDKVQMNTFKFPNPIELCPSSEETVNMKLTKNEDLEPVMVLKFYKNDIFIKSTIITQDVANSEAFVKMLNSGKVPVTIPYNEVLDLWFKNLAINKVNLKVPSTIMEIVISEIYRDPSNLSLPYRLGKTTSQPLDFKTISLKQITNYNSSFTALTFEDQDLAIINSINKTRYNEKEAETPIEKTIKY